MRKVFAFVAAALFSVATFASREVVPSDADLAKYATGTYTMCIYNETACNGIVLNGTYAGWPNAADHATLLNFQKVDGFEGWYVVTWEDATDPTDAENGGVQAKPIQLDGSGLFNWDYQLGPDAELIRGNAELLPGNNGTEVDIKNIQPGIVVIDVKSWKNNPCIAVYHVYNVTLISPDCNEEDYVVPAISGGFNGWAQEAMTLNELKTAERQNEGLFGGVFEISFKAAEGSEFKFRSAEEWGKDWTNELKEYDAEADEWKAFNGGANIVLGEETNLVYDLGDPEKYSWNNCEKPIEIEEKEFDYAITVANAPVCGEAVLAIVGGYAACNWTVADAVEVVNGAAALHAKNTDEFKFLDKSTGDWSNEVQGFPQTTFHKADLADGAEDGVITIDLAGAYYAVTCEFPMNVHIGELLYNLYIEDKTAEVVGLYDTDHELYEIPGSVNYMRTEYVVTRIGDNAFRIPHRIYFKEIPNSVTSIGSYAFYDCSSLKSFPDSVTSIGEYAFYGCSGLTSVTIGNSVTSIGEKTFYGCSGLTSVTIGNSVTSIGDRAFEDCRSLTSVTIPNSVTSIEGGVFRYCSSLTSVTIPNSVTSIGDYAFYGCSGLTSVTIGNSVTSIGNSAFEDCGLTSVVIPNSVTNIGSGAFYRCYSLTSVMMESETPPAIGTDIFSSSLVIYIPCGTIEAYKSAESWAGYAEWFKYAPSPYTITSKETNGGYVEIPYLSACDASAELTAVPERGYIFAKWEDGNTDNPRTVEVTGDRTVEAIFDYQRIGKCGKDSALTWTFDPTDFSLNIAGSGELTDNYTYGRFVKSVTIGNGISIVGNSAFYGFEQVQSIVLGTSVKVIESYAFYYCGAYFDMNTESYINDKLKSITCYSQRPPTVKEDAFNYNLPYSTIIYVPADYLATYKMHDFWGMYDVRPLGATTAETTEVKVEPTSTTASVAWPAVENAATYELVIKDKSGNVVCTLIFNANGQLTQIAFSAPARNNATQAAGFSFTVTGLEEGTSYDLTITAKDGNGTTLDEKTMSFTTATTYTTIDTLPTDELRSSKFIRNGQLFIQKAGRTYTVQGLEVK